MKKMALALNAMLSMLFCNIFAELDTGAKRIVEVMSNQDTGVAAYNKNIHYAEVQNLAQDLNIDALVKFFGCKTFVGEIFLTETISSPVSSHDKDTILRARQNVIRALIENPELKKQIETLLENARIYEQEVVELFSERFIERTCPELGALKKLQEQKSIFYPVKRFYVENQTKALLLNLYVVTISLFKIKGLGEDLYNSLKNGWQELDPKSLFWGAYYACCGGIIGYESFSEYLWAAEKRLKLHALNQFVAAAKEVEFLNNKYGIKNQFNLSDVQDKRGIALIQELQYSRYHNKKTYFFSQPAINTLLYKLYQEEKHLAEVYACIAEMDAYNAIATKMLEGSKTPNKFCFVTFTEQEIPLLKTQNFWNVLVKNAIPSTINELKKIILTGPNAGGKTTAIRALLQNLILGQSYGIAAAESFEFTPFDVIHSYLNISDDILQGRSLFASEIKRAQDILQRIKTLGPQVKYFFALDELFTGTAAEDGEVCAYEFIKKIAEFNDIQFVYATHFNKLKKLEEEGAGCVNYKVDAPKKDANGALVYPYTLSQGANQANVALDIARAANLFA